MMEWIVASMCLPIDFKFADLILFFSDIPKLEYVLQKIMSSFLWADVFWYYCFRDCVILTFKTETANFTADNLVIDHNSVLSDMSMAEAK